MYIGGAAGEHRVKKEFSSAQVNGFSRDLFVDRFTNGNNFHNNNRREEEEDDDVEVELSLGLSLNGKFGVDPAKDRVKLIRSSSVSTLFILGGDEETHASNKVPILPAAYAPLSRTCSLPTETGEVLRKRKELQSLRRMEAKRRRMDKIKFLRAGREKVDSEDYSGEENPSNGSGNSSGMVSSVNGSTGMPSSQGSIGSQGSWSSGLAEFESQPIQVVNRNNEVRRPSTMQYVQVQNDQKPRVSRPGSAAVAKAATESKEMLKNVMLEMPCVSTIGNGPNGRKIDGFLYTYRKGEEVKIVCVCHGNFMSPAEFVKHAGGAEVDNPLRHISVNNPSPVL